MPTYEYRCENCQHELESFQKITEDPLTHCPHCNHDSLKRGVGGGSATLRFKGSGFYITDYREGSPESEKEKPAEKEKPSSKCGCSGSHSC